jgi:hypothetical protein
MSKLPPFKWRYTDVNLRTCRWEGMTLDAFKSGAWYVYDFGEVLASSQHQTTGSDLEDAKRRAQGAAIALRKPLVNAEN